MSGPAHFSQLLYLDVLAAEISEMKSFNSFSTTRHFMMCSSSRGVLCGWACFKLWIIAGAKSSDGNSSSNVAVFI